MSDDRLPTVDEIFAIHEEVVQRYDLDHGGTRAYYPRRKIESARDDAAAGETPHERAAVLLKQLVDRHVFEDGNKRTAWLAATEYLTRIDDPPAVAGEEAARVLKHVRRYSAAELADWLADGTLDRDRLRD